MSNKFHATPGNPLIQISPDNGVTWSPEFDARTLHRDLGKLIKRLDAAEEKKKEREREAAKAKKAKERAREQARLKRQAAKAKKRGKAKRQPRRPLEQIGMSFAPDAVVAQ